MYRLIQIATLTMMAGVLAVSCNEFRKFNATQSSELFNDTVVVDTVAVDTLVVDTL